ncbi:hypothetical protein C7H19_18770 [Aphanothece hegewaldii CCALA 016]|uniref:PIN domain-containing protein n=1 Tax=Aphanothece hegewaldii CCALA 016 TaxID=2107694 RepID=A0A2T1LTP6_9CHRO|nr:hypothetical protein [Aphanothece hegewaldii]PSF34473.1 hypothetical protein C7H19_18770 [Aphanothece hegewaldii CCALA 016]
MVNPKKDKLRVILDTSVIISANYRSEVFSSPSIIWQAFLNEAFTLVISSQNAKYYKFNIENASE